MKKLKLAYFFGIDTSKMKLDFAFNKAFDFLNHDKVANNYQSIKTWILSKLEAEKISLDQWCFCIEQTGIYCNHLIRVLLDLGAHFSVVHSAEIKLSLGLTRGKNDKIDAKHIAKYAFRYKDKLTAYQPKRAIADQLDTLCKLRRKLKKRKNQLSLTLKSLEEFGAQAIYKLFDKLNAKSL